MENMNLDPAQTVVGISHINIIVDDVEKATEFYGRTLGFEQAYNNDGIMDYHVISNEFARDAGFLDGKVEVHVRFLKHPTIGLYLELMRYDYPQGVQKVNFFNTNDLGGTRHIALEVNSATDMFNYLKDQPDVNMINTTPDYGPPEYLPKRFKIAFFYWIDPWGVQWEMEEGRPIGEIKGIVG